jgi:hypothetical protein
VVNVKNKSHSVTAQLVVPDGGGSGVILNQGGITGGWVLYVHQGRLIYQYSFCGLQRYTVSADAPLPSGEHQVRMEFAYDGGGLGKGGTVTLYVDGAQVGSGRVERTHIVLFTFDETTDVGRDTGAPVTDDYPAGDNAYTGSVRWVEVDLGGDSHDHLITPEERLKVAMFRQ